jgi:hypothetical protein
VYDPKDRPSLDEICAEGNQLLSTLAARRTIEQGAVGALLDGSLCWYERCNSQSSPIDTYTTRSDSSTIKTEVLNSFDIPCQRNSHKLLPSINASVFHPDMGKGCEIMVE